MFVGKDAKRGILLDEECQVDIESAFLRETVAKKYASLFHSTLHHNTGYFLQVHTVISLHILENVRCKFTLHHICMCESHPLFSFVLLELLEEEGRKYVITQQPEVSYI